MGKILNTTYHDSVQNITNFYNDLVNNPFYIFNEKKPVICTYYNINKDFSSLDPGSKLNMDNIGDESPIKYNRIYDFLIYGFSRIELNNENSEFGLESDRISGECYILPNTIIPTEGDYFELEHVKSSTWLFIITDVQKDTLDNGSNVFKLSYKLEYHDNSQILSNIVHNFRLIDKQEGTNIARIVRCEDYDIAKIMDEKAVLLKKYFVDLFYSDKVQTFVYMDLTEYRIYDPFMIEFLIRNRILDNGEDSYIYVTHQIPVINTFSIEYDKTFFRIFEKCDKNNLMASARDSSIDIIKSFGTTFSSRYEDYFKTTYLKMPGYNISCLSDELVIDILEENIVPNDQENKKSRLWENIIIKYFLKQDLVEEDLCSIEKINFESSKDAFYIIPLLIFCLERAIEKTLK